MSLKDRVARKLRQNLNVVLDAVAEFEAQGGVKGVVEDLGFEEIGGRPATRSAKSQKTISEYYANLEVPYGSDIEVVKESYRTLMRRYHPDRHAGDPEMEALATELSQELTRAYTAIEAYLSSGRY